MSNKNRQSPNRSNRRVENKKTSGTSSTNTNNNGGSGPKQNAWSKGAPHVTTGGSGSTSPSLNSGTASPSNNEDSAKLHMHDRFGFLLTKGLGCYAVATVTTGAKFRGIFSGANAENDLGVVLKYATQIESAPGEDDQDKKPNTQDCLVIASKDLAELEIEKVNLAPEEPDLSSSSASSNSRRESSKNGFRTDTDISGVNASSFERELQPWNPEDHEVELGALEDASGGSQSWDQFAVNKEKFGVHSTYDEHYYTTAINKNLPNYQEIEKKAEKLAQEISSESYGGNIHLAEERGIVVDDSGLDEEDKYSGVDRKGGASSSTTASSNNNAANPNKYTPPQFRAPSGKKQQGVPYDPAIISSSLATPDGRLSNRTPPSQETKSAADNTTKQGIEKELAGNFRQFVNVEKERLNQKKHYLQKKEMTEQLDKLKKFSEGYKINAPVPADLIPILSKDRGKQEQIKQRAAASATASPSSSTATPVTTAAKQSLAPQSSSPASKPSQKTGGTGTTSAASTSSPKKFNFNAAEFKPNPSAHSFTPHIPASAMAPQSQPPPPQGSSASPRQASSSNSPVQPQSPYTKPSPRTPTVQMFFGNSKTPGSAKATKGKFNPFLRAKAEHEQASRKHKEDPESNPAPPIYVIERAYVQGPTWPAGPSDKSYMAAFSTYENTPRQYASPRAGGAGMMFPAGMPMMQPPIPDDPNMRMMGSPPPPMPAQMIPAGFVPAMGYPQQHYPGYYAGAGNSGGNGNRPGGGTTSNIPSPGPQFMSPQVMNQFPVMQYGQPGAYGSSGGNMRAAQAAMAPPPMYYQGQHASPPPPPPPPPPGAAQVPQQPQYNGGSGSGSGSSRPPSN